MVFKLKQYIKMLLQNLILPAVYGCFRHKKIQKGLVLFADAHHEEIPFSMKRVYDQLIVQPGNAKEIRLFICDFQKLGLVSMVKYLIGFMKAYAVAEYVIICDYYLPVSSCKKRKETKVVQLWHSCGLMKKIAYDTGEDIPAGYKGNMFGNYSCLTLSAPVCIPVHERALRLPAERIHATGVSRTDYYFDDAWNRQCKERFYQQNPQAAGKKIALWAPTFRGNAADPRLEGLEELQQVMKHLEKEWYFVLKAHPHIDAHGQVSNCTMPTEEIFAAADLLITDYSSTMFDYLLYQKPIILFCPDLERYQKDRGFYLEYEEIPYQLVKTGKELEKAVQYADYWQNAHLEEIRQFTQLYVGSCDGHATERILKLVGLWEEHT